MKLKDLEKKVWDRYWRKAKSSVSMSSRLGGVIDFFGPHVEIKQIQQTDLDDLIDHCLSIGNSPATINRKLSVFSKIQQFAFDRGYTDKLLKMEYQKEASGRIRFLTSEEESKMFHGLVQAEQPHIGYFIFVMIDTGMRPSEIRSLKPQDIKDGWITVSESKNSTARRIPMTSRVRRLLESSLLKNITEVSQYLLNYYWNFVKHCNGWTDDTELVPYACRHTFASRLIQKGADITTIMKLMGHKNIQMTMRYAHLAPGNLEDTVKLLEGE